MAKKPRYEELKKSVKALRQENDELRRVLDALRSEKEARRKGSGDITDEEQKAEASRENGEKYRELFENESDGVMIFDAETLRFEDANPATLTMYGYSKQEFLGLTVEDISAEIEKTKISVKKVKTGDPDSKFVPLRYFRRKDGSVFPGEICAGSFVSGNRKKIIGAVRDITDRIRTEDAQHASEEKYRVVVNNAPIGIVVTQEGNLQFVNPAVVKASGFSETELTTRSLVDFVHPDDRELVRKQYTKRISGKEILKPYQLRIVTKEGNILFVENSGVRIQWEGKPATLNFLADVTERTLMEKALRQHEMRFQTIVESSPFGYFRLGKDGRYQYVNPRWEAMHGLTGGKIIGKNIETTEPEEDRIQLRELFRRAIKGETIHKEFKHLLKDGAYSYHEVTLQPVYQYGEITGVEGFVNNLTEQKRNEELIRNLSHLLMQAQERERQMISYELHDRIAQNLSTMKIECAMLFDGQPTISSSLEDKKERLSKLLDLTITSVRDLAYNLRPPGLNEMSIVKAIEIYCEEFSESTGVDIDFQFRGMQALDLDYDTKLHLYRLVQEGLNNIRKHASAYHATIKLIGASPNIILRIEDNGKGFDVKERERSLDNRKRMGLRSMQERVHLLGGQMKVRSRPESGTRIFIKFPLKEKESDSEKAHHHR